MLSRKRLVEQTLTNVCRIGPWTGATNNPYSKRMISKRMIYVLIALVVLAPIVGLAVLSALAKKPQNLGVVEGRLAACPNSPNCVSTQAADELHSIKPLTFAGSPEQALQRLKAAIATIPRMKIATENGDYLHAEATSLIFRFVDDVEFLVDRQAKVIHVRSASRVGRSDLGVNRARLEKIRQAFDQPSAP
jgi:uncharacterized protein (DUF1499 family)